MTTTTASNAKRVSFRDWVRDDDSSPFQPEVGRYHLYVSYACPWAHRTLITRSLLGLEAAIGLSVVDPVMEIDVMEIDGDGWRFSDAPGCIPDEVNGKRFLREIYEVADPEYRGRWTVPVLWDKKRRTIVNNESREIMRMMTSAFRPVASRQVELLPVDAMARIDETIDWLYDGINDGVYRVGFARSQAAYDEAIDDLFGALDHAERQLAEDRFLCGRTSSEADICLCSPARVTSSPPS